jgi:uncharacterized protein involved in exopolysaccharide biosynthesis
MAFATPLFLAAGCASNDTALLEERIFELEKRVLALETREMASVTEAEKIMRANLAQLRMERASLSRKYTDKHPVMQKIDAQIHILEKDITVLRAREELAELKVERENMEKRYTKNHPEMIKLNQRIKDLLELIGE